MLEQAFPHLPQHSQALLQQVGRVRGAHRLFSLEPSVFGRVLAGLKFMSPEALRVPQTPEGYGSLFRQLASTRIVSTRALESPQAVERRQQLEKEHPYPSQQGEASMLSGTLGIPGQMDEGPEIPKKIHRFWTGGAMSEDAMATLEESIGKTDGKGWQHTLWHSAEIEKGLAASLAPEKIEQRQLQRQHLQKLGYQIRPIEELARNKPLFFGQTTRPNSPVDLSDLKNAGKFAASSATRRDYDDVKYYSDLSRLLYLHQEGGFHFDIDVGLGGMDLDRQYRHHDPEGKIPLMGSLLRDRFSGSDVIKHLATVQGLQRRGAIPHQALPRYTESVTALAHQARLGAGMYNALIASRAENPHLEQAAKAFVQHFKRKKSFQTGMAFNKHLLGGTDDFERKASLTVPPYLLRLEHYTPESDR